MPKPVKLLLLLLITLLGGWFRLQNLNWDQFHMYHPDERNIANAVTKLNLPDKLDPGFHAYNGFFIYLTRFAAQNITQYTKDNIWTSDWGHIALISRYLSATFSTLSLPLLFILLSSFFTPAISLISTALFAFSPGLIQYAHYGVTESLLVFWFLLLCLASIRAYHQPKFLLNWFYLSAICGLSLATKTSAALFLVIPFIVWLLTFHHQPLKHFLFGIYFLLNLFLITFIFSPYSFLDFTHFRQSMLYESGVATGTLQVPYNLQFLNTPPYIFSFLNLFWQLGPLIPLFGALGLLFIFLSSLRRPRFRPLLPVVIFGLIYFAYVGGWYTKFIRYQIPFIPLIVIGFAYPLSLLHRRLPAVYLTLAICALLTSLLWATAHAQVYLQPHTRLTASGWIYQNIPDNSVILHEHWDDQLPTDIDGQASRFNDQQVKSYDPDSPTKLKELMNQLSQGDYYIISSKRVYGSIIRAPSRYPLMSRFYQLLFANQAGYHLVQTFSSYPRLGSLIVNDDQAEETLQVYDHPVIYIFQKDKSFSSSSLTNLFSPYIR